MLSNQVFVFKIDSPLAQLVLLVLMASKDEALQGGRILMRCDNEGVVGAAAKGMSTAHPLCAALQCLAAWESVLNVKTVIQHIPGEDNVLADSLSSWRTKRHLLWKVRESNQHRVDLDMILRPFDRHAPMQCNRDITQARLKIGVCTSRVYWFPGKLKFGRL